MLGLQLVLTLAVFWLVPGGWAKLFGFLICWALTFRILGKAELLAYASVSILFSVMDVAAVRQGVFAFSAPDYLGLPVWEFFMWGFYVLHALRVLNGPVPRGSLRAAAVLGCLFAAPFVALSNSWMLLAASAILLALALVFFHERGDWAYVGYMMFIGTAIEYTGVWSGQWGYPGSPPGGVPLWFLTMWGGVGLFTRRLVVPFVCGAPMPAGGRP